MQETPQTSEKPAVESAVIHGVLGVLCLVLGVFFPVHWGLQHPSVVKKAAGKTPESLVQFGQARIQPTKGDPNLSSALLVSLAATHLEVDKSDELKTKLDGHRFQKRRAIRLFINQKEENKLRQHAASSEKVRLIFEMWERPELDKYKHAIFLTAWLQHNDKLGAMADELAQFSKSGNLPGLRKFYMAMGTLGDLMDEFQLMQITALMPDIKTMTDFSHISLVQTMLPPFHTINNGGRRENTENPKIEIGELELHPLKKYFKEIDIDGDGEIFVNEWVKFGHLPLEMSDFPLTYTAVIWAGTPEISDEDQKAQRTGAKQVVDYLMKHGRAGDQDLHQAMKHGKGALMHLVQSGERISPRGSSDSMLGVIADFSLNNPKLAGSIRLLLMILGAILTLRMFTLFKPVTLTNPKSANLYRWQRRATALVLLTLLVMAGEPILLQSAASSEYEVAVKLKIPDIEPNTKDPAPMIAAAANTTSDYAWNIGMIVVFLFIQIWVYLVCKNKIDEICNSNDSPEQKLRLLENEDNLFDLGLYIGIAGTALGLGLIMIGAFTKPYGAYVSNIMGIACVAMVKIRYLRDRRQQLLDEANKAPSS